MANLDSQVIEKFLYQDEPSPIIGREVVWINDETQVYNSQIVFNMSTIGTTQKWLSYAESYIQIPYVVSMKSSSNLEASMTAAKANLMVSPKDFFGQIIDSISVEVNGRTVHQQQSFNNVHSYFKAITSIDNDYLTKNSSTTGIFLDTIDKKNISIANTTFAPTGVYVNNESSSVVTRNAEIISTGNLNVLNTSSLDAVKSAGGSYYTTNGIAAENRIYYWVIMCLVKLSDITDFFNKLPICKCTDIRLLLNYNASDVNLAMSAAGAITGSTVVQVSGNTCPYTVQMATAVVAAPAAPYIMNFKSGVMRTTQGDPGITLSACRLYVPVYEISPATALNMIKMKPRTTVNYNDVYTYQISNKESTADVVETISTGIINAKYIVVIPFPNVTPLAWQSPFDTAPATSSNIVLQNFQVQVGGRNVFRADVKYDYNMFMDELSKINALEGNNNNSMNSGVLRQYLFQNSHRLYVADLSRHEPSDSLISKSIVVSFKNAGAVSVSCLVFVAYGRSVSLDTATGISTDMIAVSSNKLVVV